MIHKLHITGYRSFKDLTVDGLGRVNLITGRNNVGKSTLLEAIRLWATSGAATTFLSVLFSREEANRRHERTQQIVADRSAFTSFNRLFHNYPAVNQHNRVFSVAVDNEGKVETLTATIGWRDDGLGIQQELKLGNLDDSQPIRKPSIPVLSTHTSKYQQRLMLDYAWDAQRDKEPGLEYDAPCLFLDPFSSRSTDQLATLWDEVALTEGADAIVEALQIISNDIQAVTMVGDSAQRSRTAMAKSRQHDQPIPLKSFGDGVNRVFGLILSLVCAKGGYLLIDEIENGLHYSIQADAFRAIFKLARDLNVQVFATTHSRDCIEAFQQAAAESPEDGALVRLTRKDDKIFSTVFAEDRLQIATENQIEVR